MSNTSSVALALSACLGALGAHAQSKEDTAIFIQEKASLKYENHSGVVTERTYIQFGRDMCYLTSVIKWSHDDGRPEDMALRTVELADLDPGDIQPQHPDNKKMILVYATGRKDRVNFQLCKAAPDFDNVTCDPVRQDKDNHIAIPTTSERNAGKVARAMSHLIKLCGGKGELF